jgi:hypothetical protein
MRIDPSACLIFCMMVPRGLSRFPYALSMSSVVPPHAERICYTFSECACPRSFSQNRLLFVADLGGRRWQSSTGRNLPVPSQDHRAVQSPGSGHSPGLISPQRVLQRGLRDSDMPAGRGEARWKLQTKHQCTCRSLRTRTLAAPHLFFCASSAACPRRRIEEGLKLGPRT